MPAKSPITNAEIKTSAYSAEGRKNHDRIFSKKPAKEWMVEDKIFAIYAGCFNGEDGVTMDTPIPYSEFKKRTDLAIMYGPLNEIKP